MKEPNSIGDDTDIIGLCCCAALCLCYYVKIQYYAITWCWSLSRMDADKRAQANYVVEVMRRHLR